MRLFAPIGLLVLLTQPGRSQSAGDLLALDPGSRQLARAFERQFPADRPARWPSGWQLARDIGRPAVALLRRLHRRPSRTKARWLLIGAEGAAAGPTALDSFGEGDWLRKADAGEQLMALLVVAMGDSHPGKGEVLRRLVAASRAPALVRVAACLGLARCSAPEPLPSRFFEARERRDDPGLVAAATLGGGAPPARLLRTWLDARSRPVGRSLLRRACLLARHGVPLPTAELEDLARSLLVSRDVPERLAAASWLGRAAEVAKRLEALAQRPEGASLLLLAATPQGRAAALRSGWLTSSPTPRLSAELRRRLVVLHTLSAPLDQVLKDAPRWSGRTETAGARALALAWRLFRLTPAEAPHTTAELGDLPERVWVDLALGQEPKTLPASSDAALARALPLAAAGRLSRAAAARELERALWRMGSHPGLTRFELRVALLGDLLLSGSEHAKAREGRRRSFGYLPRGLPPGAPEFEVAYEFLRWYVKAVGIPDELRLRP